MLYCWIDCLIQLIYLLLINVWVFLDGMILLNKKLILFAVNGIVIAYIYYSFFDKLII